MMMRTTLTLDADIAEKLKEEMRQSGKSFREVVNDLLRAGISLRKEIKQMKKPFKVHSKSLGEIRGLNYNNIAELLESIEGPVAR
jgi:predicted CopG family antitoxin